MTGNYFKHPNDLSVLPYFDQALMTAIKIWAEYVDEGPRTHRLYQFMKSIEKGSE